MDAGQSGFSETTSVASPPESRPSHSHQPRESIDIQIPGKIGEPGSGEKYRRENRGPDQLAPHQARDRRTGIGAGRTAAILVLATHAERQGQEQHNPPDDEVDRERCGDGVGHVQACSISTRAPEKSFGCRNSTGLPWAPIFGTPSPSTRAPSLIRMSRAAMMSGTS